MVNWRLGGQEDLVPVSILQGLAHHLFALFAVVGPCGVYVVDAAIDSMTNHFHRLFFVYVGGIVVNGGKAHTAKPQGRYFYVKLTELPIMHLQTSKIKLLYSSPKREKKPATLCQVCCENVDQPGRQVGIKFSQYPVAR